MIQETTVVKKIIFNKTDIFVSFVMIWAIILLLLSFFSYPLAVEYWFLPNLVVLALTLLTPILVIWAIVNWRRQKQSFRKAMLRILFPIAVVILSSWVRMSSYDFFTYFKMPLYQEIVSGLESNTIRYQGSSGVYKGVGFQIDKTDGQIRVAFEDGTGIIDNWCGLIWDPTGMVEQSNIFKRDWSNWNDSDLQKVKGLFGGDLMWVNHKKSSWYYGCFT